MDKPKTKDEYEAAIPECCKWQTYELHHDVMLLCWGITHGLMKPGYCDGCTECKNTAKEKGGQP